MLIEPGTGDRCEIVSIESLTLDELRGAVIEWQDSGAPGSDFGFVRYESGDVAIVSDHDLEEYGEEETSE